MNTNYCYLLEIEAHKQFYYTTYDQDILVADIVYKSQSGLSIGTVHNQIDTYATASINGSINDECINEEDILYGSFDNAKISIKLCDYSHKTIIKNIFTGIIPSISYDNNIFKADINGIGCQLDKKIMDTYTPFCRTNFGSKECGVDINKYSYNANIVKIIDSSNFVVHLDSYKPSGFFNFGTLKHQDKIWEIKSFHNNIVTTNLPIPNLNIDDSIILFEGCSKRFECCVSKFNNALNFRGEPHIPGIQEILQKTR
ncbi:MAG: hypothetical protein BGO27_01335 [Alphaproteobacteria bacterium 33-17]|nr:MAG: hypothetical protein BGO27_01335 [Alphaproteobacteria bacterium 33-17]